MPLTTATFEQPITRIARLDYLISLPSGYDEHPDRRWPLMLFLHGAGERGDDVNRLRVNGIPRVVDRGDDLPLIIVAPQCPHKTLWAAQLDALDALLNEIEATYRVDHDRVYLTGLSMGGNGTWHLAAAYPKRFAAMAPICGWGDFWKGFPDEVKVLKDVPIWTFHGAKDTVVPLSSTQVLVDTLQEAGGNPKLTVYPEAGHDSWTEAYDTPELYDWFLSHHL